MKELRIPIPLTHSIDLSEINANFNGLIIGYKGDSAAGYIQYYDGTWYFIVDICSESSVSYDETLLDLINSLIRNNVCSYFKVIEFAQC